MDRFNAATLQFENDVIKSRQENVFFLSFRKILAKIYRVILNYSLKKNFKKDQRRKWIDSARQSFSLKMI